MRSILARTLLYTPISRTCSRPLTRFPRAFRNMADKPFEKMEAEIPKASEPSKAAAPKQEEQDLPKLSPQEFRIYNRMAEHMVGLE